MYVYLLSKHRVINGEVSDKPENVLNEFDHDVLEEIRKEFERWKAAEITNSEFSAVLRRELR